MLVWKLGHLSRASYARKLSEIAEVLEAASGKIVALDKEQAALFGLSK